jgi:formate-dependent nitrite reductase membrane component NrfD
MIMATHITRSLIIAVFVYLLNVSGSAFSFSLNFDTSSQGSDLRVQARVVALLAMLGTS